MKKQSFLQGALTLILAGFTNRALGFILRIIIVRKIGDEGLGLFQKVYPLFLTSLLLCTAGFPVAISKLIPEKKALGKENEKYALLKTTLFSVTISSILISLLLYISSEYIAVHIYNDHRLYLIIISIVPALIISALAACLRGFFQGIQTMMPTSLSQITEQSSRFIATITLLSTLSMMPLKFQAAGITLGICIGEFSGLLLLIGLFIKYIFQEKKLENIHGFRKIAFSKNQYVHHLKAITHLAVPITLGRITNSLIMSSQAVLIPRKLESAGLSLSTATSFYGQLSGIVEQLISLPTIITIALTISLIPSVSNAYAHKNFIKIKSNYQDVIRICFYIGLPATVIFITQGPAICGIIFGYPEAGELLKVMAFSASFIYYLQVSHGMLNGLGKARLAFVNLSLGSALKLTGIIFLTPILGINGAVLSICFGYILSSILNFIVIGHEIGFKLNISQCFLKPLICSTVLFFLNDSIYIKHLLSLNINNYVQLSIHILLFIFIYLFLMFFIKAITKEDICRFTGGHSHN